MSSARRVTSSLARRGVVIGTVLLLGGVHAQQVADPNYQPDVPFPRYAGGSGPTILFDRAHRNFHTLDSRYQGFAKLVSADGYSLHETTEGFTATGFVESLEASRILVIANACSPSGCDASELAFSDAEVATLVRWVSTGGSLFLIFDHPPFSSVGNLASALGIEILPGPGISGQDSFHQGDSTLASDDPITSGECPEETVESVETFFGSGFVPLPSPRPDVALTPIMLFGPDAFWDAEGQSHSAEGALQGAAIHFGEGRVYVSGEAAMFTAQFDGVPFGFNLPNAQRNQQFLLNILHWLDKPPLDDCNANGSLDHCDIARGQSADCDGDSVPDECQITTGASTDCNQNGRPDSCDVGTVELEFQRPVSFSTVESPSALVVADLDRDGHLDLATANLTSDSVSVLWNHGDGTFADAVLYDGVGDGPQRIATADFDRDGTIDIIVANRNSKDLSILHGAEDRVLLPAMRLVLGFRPSSRSPLLALDLNQDGRVDLTLVDDERDVVSVLLNDGHGGFEKLAQYAAGVDPRSLVAGDMDGEHGPELLTVDRNSKAVWILPNRGDGTFGEARVVDLGFASVQLAVADVDGAGMLDLVVSKSVSTVSILLSTGNETFGEALDQAAWIDLGFAGTPGPIVPVDLNGDGYHDLATLLPNPRGVAVLRSRGDGTFEAGRLHSIGGARALATADLDGDGRSDLVVPTSRSLAVFLNDTAPPLSIDCDRNHVPDDCDLANGAADVDDDGILDRCELDCDGSGVPDDYELSQGTSQDCSGDSIPDQCEPDCDLSGSPDICDIAAGRALDCNVNGVPDICDIAGGGWTDLNANGVPDECEPVRFRRGDCDGDGTACSGVNDALELLNWLFLGRAEPPCLAACDPDGNGELELADAVYGLNFCFAGTDAPVAPFPECGVDTEMDRALGCVTATCE